jgi:hypothetical protein
MSYGDRFMNSNNINDITPTILYATMLALLMGGIEETV